MGEALVAGFQRGGFDVGVHEPLDDRARDLAAKYDVALLSLSDVANYAVVVLAVKPAQVAAVLESIELDDACRPLVLSVAAGISISSIAAGLPVGTDVVRVMPNTPALIGEGMSVLTPGPDCSTPSVEIACELMACVGRIAIVPESDQDAVTALSGSGPAYFFLVVEALVEAGVALGLAPEIAHELAVQTAYGASAMMRESDDGPARLRENVTSPGGTTAAALGVLEADDLRGAFGSALAAARDRSIELGS